jgi:hypothetical protein
VSLIKGKDKLAVMTRIPGGSAVQVINVAEGEASNSTRIPGFYGEAVITCGSSDFIAAFGPPEETPCVTRIRNCYPKPFNPEARVTFDIEERSVVDIAIFDVTGRLVKTLLDKETPPGTYTASWNGKNLSGTPVSSGVYL